MARPEAVPSAPDAAAAVLEPELVHVPAAQVVATGLSTGLAPMPAVYGVAPTPPMPYPVYHGGGAYAPPPPGAYVHAAMPPYAAHAAHAAHAAQQYVTAPVYAMPPPPRPHHAGGPGRRGPPADYVCHRCNQTGHFIGDCPTRGQPRFTPTGAVPPPNYLCHRCNQPGHFIGDCPTRLEDGAGGDGSPSGRGRGVPAGNYVCHRCNQRGHFIQDCPTNGDPAWNRPVGGVPPPHYTCHRCQGKGHFIDDCPTKILSSQPVAVPLGVCPPAPPYAMPMMPQHLMQMPEIGYAAAGVQPQLQESPHPYPV